ncbi:uncharacterized protein N7515_007247 [Penicillium bovifimosum]|uniref:Uncharacterized protein n=1 Tax=Penicillium bovifimosum TaxID=126998 RepID=A0A9W9L0I3_9EURO|nr:uncharacterized protein N7515_007247 [Penicillium bovifimosum]KAJ5131208.1 hypothetical protein N7515_007247 [Penicillium bovifimosum]
MASVGKPPLEDTRRTTGSPKMKSRGELISSIKNQISLGYHSCDRAMLGPPGDNAKDTLCRNVTIYGRCRYEDKGIHEP